MLHKEFGYESLQLRRKFRYLCTFYKIRTTGIFLCQFQSIKTIATACFNATILVGWGWQFLLYSGYAIFPNLLHPLLSTQIKPNHIQHIPPTIFLGQSFFLFLASSSSMTSLTWELVSLPP